MAPAPLVPRPPVRVRLDGGPAWLRRAVGALGLALALAWGGGAAAQGDLPPEEAREMAVQAVLSGDAALAREVASRLLEADPDDRAALVALAAAETRLGRAEEGRRAAARAWALSTTRPQRFEAARLAAVAAAEEGRPFLAELWLRRALTVAPDEEQEARTLEEARRLRAQSPWRVQAELGVTPSDNVNGGAETPFITVEGLPFVGVISVDGRALSGWVGTGALDVTRRLSESRRQRTELALRLSGRGVALSEESHDLIEAERDAGDPAIEGSDFASVQAELRLGHRRALGRGIVGGDLSLGRRWYGDEEPVTSLRLSGLAARELGEDRILRLSVYGDERRAEGEGASDQRRVGAELAWGTRLRDSDHLTLALSRSATLSDNGNQASDGWGVRASYAPGEPLGPARLGGTVGASWTEFPDYAVILPVPGGRQDERVFGRLEAVFEDWSTAGFAPVVSLEAARTDSNVSRFDTESLGLGVTLRSTF